MTKSNNLDSQYLNILNDVLTNGSVKSNRTGINTKSVFSRRIRHDMSEGFPILTTKRVPFKMVASELEMFIKGITDKSWLQARNNSIWDEWCDPRKVPYGHDMLTKAKMRAEPELGQIYSAQLRNFEDTGFDQLNRIVQTLKTNPNDRRMVVSYWGPMNLTQSALPACFIKDTLVATKDKYKNIQDVIVGDFVLTDTGIYKQVTNVSCIPFNGKAVRIKVNNTPIITCTPEHPFLVKDLNNNIIWKKAIDVSINDKVLSSTDNIAIDRTLPVFNHMYHSNGTQESFMRWSPSLDDVWMYGYFLGDGCLIKNSKKIMFAICDRDVDSILQQLRKSIKISKCGRKSGASQSYSTSGTKHLHVLQQFIDIVNNDKIIPSWVYKLPNEYIKTFIDGYFAADGCKSKRVLNTYLATTVSPSVAFGLQRLTTIVGYSMGVHFSKKPSKTIIMGRTVNQRDVYQLNMTVKPRYKRDFVDSGQWTKVNNIEYIDINENVYNMTVVDNHTYTVNNIVVHNCHWSWICNVTDGKLNIEFNMRSVDWPLGAPFDIAHYGLLLHLLAKETNLLEGEIVGNFTDVHVYENQIEPVKVQLTREHFALPKIQTNNWKSIYEWQYTDSVLVDYNAHPSIKMEVAV